MTSFTRRRSPAGLLCVLLVLGHSGVAQAHHHDHDGGGENPAQAQPVDDGSTAGGSDPSVVPVVDPEGPPALGTLGPVAPPVAAIPTTTAAMVPGTVARMRTDGRAAVPRAAPARVRTLIRAANQIIGKPYLWGGGHARLTDTGYDCSGAVSYTLIRAGLLGAPMVSGTLAHTYAPGSGRFVSIYANADHVYLEVAGLRLDTSPVGDPLGQAGVRWRPVIGKRHGFAARHPVGD